MGKYIIKKTKTGWTFSLKASNSETIGISEVYTTESACRKGIESVRKNAPAAVVEDQTVEGFAVEKNPKFEIYLDKVGGYRFRLKATNGQIITSSEGYKQKSGCKNGIESVRKNSDGEVVEEEGGQPDEESVEKSAEKPTEKPVEKEKNDKPVERKKK